MRQNWRVILIFSKLNMTKLSHLFCGNIYEFLKSVISSSNTLDHLFFLQLHAIFFTTLTADLSFSVYTSIPTNVTSPYFSIRGDR